MPLLKLKEGTVYYEQSGQGAPTIVFLHGGLIDSRLWDPQFNWFAQRARVIRYDMPGAGRSETPREEFSGVEVLYEILAWLDIEQTVLIGLSGGARIAIDFAIAHPEKTERLVTVAPGLSGYEDWTLPERNVEEVREAIRGKDRDGAANAWLTLWAPVTKAQLFAAGRANAESLFSNVRLKDLDPPAIGRLDEVSAPTLVVVGDQDLPDIRRIADIIAADVSGAQRKVMHGADHFPNVHDPRGFNETVAAFLGLTA
jgi:3-oxoadipate enol-lactonase